MEDAMMALESRGAARMAAAQASRGRLIGYRALTLLLAVNQLAGLFFDFSGALFAHAAAGDGLAFLAGPLVSIAALFGSWSLRPRSRRAFGVAV